MHRATLRLPASRELSVVLGFARELDYYANHEQITIDCGEERFFAPYAMLFIAAKILSFRKKNPDIIVDVIGHRSHDYLAHMGFFNMAGFDHGREIGSAVGWRDYISITRLSREDLIRSPGDHFEEIPDLVQRHADEIASVISRGEACNKDMYDVLAYSIREVMRNVFEHAEADALYYCAQYWPKSNKVEFAIIDFGVGIRRGLSENPNFRFKTDKEAIEASLLPSVSGKTHLPRLSNNWFNSGYGLYMTNRLARNGGNFILASGNTAVHLSRKIKNNYQTSFPGTALRFNLDVNQIGDVQRRLNEFRKDGAEIAKTIAGSGNRPPSAMSLLLRRDYAVRPK